MEKTKNESEIKIALLQTDIVWENRKANFSFISDAINKLEESVDLVVLPETFTSGFSMNVPEISDGGEETLSWMKQLSISKGISIAGSAIIKEKGLFYNRLYFTEKDGAVSCYDKRHLFRIEQEQDYFTPGSQRVIVRVGPFRILLQTCYDLRFPVFSRYKGDYDAILYVANWPASRQHIWETLLRSRAIENQAYVMGVNRVGVDGDGLAYAGGTCLIHPHGKDITVLDNTPGSLISAMNIDEVKKLRVNFPVYEDADQFRLD